MSDFNNDEAFVQKILTTVDKHISKDLNGYHRGVTITVIQGFVTTTFESNYSTPGLNPEAKKYLIQDITSWLASNSKLLKEYQIPDDYWEKILLNTVKSSYNEMTENFTELATPKSNKINPIKQLEILNKNFIAALKESYSDNPGLITKLEEEHDSLFAGKPKSQTPQEMPEISTWSSIKALLLVILTIVVGIGLFMLIDYVIATFSLPLDPTNTFMWVFFPISGIMLFVLTVKARVNRK